MASVMKLNWCEKRAYDKRDGSLTECLGWYCRSDLRSTGQPANDHHGHDFNKGAPQDELFAADALDDHEAYKDTHDFDDVNLNRDQVSQISQQESSKERTIMVMRNGFASCRSVATTVAYEKMNCTPPICCPAKIPKVDTSFLNSTLSVQRLPQLPAPASSLLLTSSLYSHSPRSAS